MDLISPTQKIPKRFETYEESVHYQATVLTIMVFILRLHN